MFHSLRSGNRDVYTVDADGTNLQQRTSSPAEELDTDWAPDRFLDLRPFDPADPKYGGPPAGFVLPEPPVYVVGDAPFTRAETARGAGRFSVLSAPENAVRPDTALNALIARAGAGDEIMLMQL